jgi:hypothetical protein
MAGQTLRRRFRFIANVEGDTLADLAKAIRHLADRVERNDIGGCSICGGPSNSHIASLIVDEAVTHDSYFAAITAELAALGGSPE